MACNSFASQYARDVVDHPTIVLIDLGSLRDLVKARSASQLQLGDASGLFAVNEGFCLLDLLVEAVLFAVKDLLAQVSFCHWRLRLQFKRLEET